jgi:hypothetical protein
LKLFSSQNYANITYVFLWFQVTTHFHTPMHFFQCSFLRNLLLVPQYYFFHAKKQKLDKAIGLCMSNSTTYQQTRIWSVSLDNHQYYMSAPSVKYEQFYKNSTLRITLHCRYERLPTADTVESCLEFCYLRFVCVCSRVECNYIGTLWLYSMC